MPGHGAGEPGRGGAWRAEELRWSFEEVAQDTPSRRDGVSEQAERAARFAACQFARGMVRELLCSGSRAEMDEASSRAQMLACLFVQFFFMFRSLQHEDSRVVATAAAFLACKVGDVPRRMRDLLRTHNAQRTKAGAPELEEEQQHRLRERILQVEFLLLRIIRFDFDISLPLEEVDGLADRLLTGLTRSAPFREWAAARGQQPVSAATELRPQVARVARNFLNDAFLGLGPLLFAPRIVAAGAVVFAARYTIRKMAMPMGELCRLFGDCDVPGQVERASEEILKVFKLSSASAAGSAAAAPTAAAAARAPPRTLGRSDTAESTGGATVNHC